MGNQGVYYTIKLLFLNIFIKSKQIKSCSGKTKVFLQEMGVRKQGVINAQDCGRD